MRKSYNTKQKSIIEEYFTQNSQRYISVDEIYKNLTEKGTKIGKVTIYRYIDKLMAEGKLHKNYSEHKEKALYRFGHTSECKNHFHLKCLSCEKIFHLNCSAVSSITQHLEADHAFSLEPSKTVLYGYCEDCK